MEQSHAALGKTRDEYHTQAGVLKQSKGLLGTLNWQQTAVRTPFHPCFLVVPHAGCLTLHLSLRAACHAACHAGRVLAMWKVKPLQGRKEPVGAGDCVRKTVVSPSPCCCCCCCRSA